MLFYDRIVTNDFFCLIGGPSRMTEAVVGLPYRIVKKCNKI